MKGTVFTFTLISIIAKIVAFGRELLLSSYYGTSEISDVYLLSMTLPVTIFGFVSTGIISGYIPIYVDIEREKGKEGAVSFTNQVLNTLIILCIIIIVFYWPFSRQLIRILASGFSEHSVDLAVRFTNISIWAIIFTCIITVYTGFLQINNRLQITATISIPLNTIIIISIILAKSTNQIIILPIGYTTAVVFQTMYVLCFVKKTCYHYRITLGSHSRYLRRFYQTIGMLAMGSSITQINLLIDRTLATRVTVGGLSVFEYGSRINDLIISLSITPICTAIFPQMVKVADNINLLKEEVSRSITFFFQIIAPVTVILLIFSESIVKAVYYRGAFDEQSLLLTSQVVFYYGMGLFAFALRDLLSKAFYSISDTKTPMVNSIIGVTLNIILNIVLSQIMGVGGLSLATSISAIITVILLYVSLTKKIGKIYLGNYKREVEGIILTIVCSPALMLAYKLIKNWLDIEFISLGVSVFIYIVVYGIALYKFNLIEYKNFLKRRAR